MARKVLVLDIETSPHLCYSFQTYKSVITPAQVLEPTRMISFAAKWVGKPKVAFHSEFEGFGPGLTREECHRDMVLEAHRLLDECDVLVHYNGDRFDIPHMEREFELAGLKPPSPYISVDLYKVYKRDTVFAFHKLAWITEQLKLSGKMENSGWRLWKAVLSDDPEARRKGWLEMRKYNKQDVVTTEELYKQALPRIRNLPSEALYRPDDGSVTCPNCDSDNWQSRGFAYTKTRKYSRYQCTDCGKWFKGTRSIDLVTVTT